ncbi:MAG TPA: pre-toxin TG domain-containing protein [Vicinamibacteria bacterium]|nr:pre-toxin TG domain-containing protein [Vicinamibacteria bacterium]
MSAPDFELPTVEAPFEIPHLDPQKPAEDPVAADGGVLIPPAAGADAQPTYIPQAVLDADAKLASALVNLVPMIGTAKGAIEAFTGKDMVTGEHLAWWERGLNIVAVIPTPEGEAAEASKVVQAMEAMEKVHHVLHVVHVGEGIYEVNEAAEKAGEGTEGGAGEGSGGGGTPGLNPPPSLPH